MAKPIDATELLHRIETLEGQFGSMKRARAGMNIYPGYNLLGQDTVISGNLDVEGTINGHGLTNPGGWLKFLWTWVYNSQTSATIDGDWTVYLKIGVKVRLFNNTIKYGYVLSSSYNAGTNLTTVNLVANTNYGLATGQITDVYISYGNPPDFPVNFFYSVSPTGFSSITSVSNSHFAINNRICTLAVNIIDGISNATTFTFNLPVASALTIETAVFINPIDNNTIYQHPMAYISIASGSLTATCYLSIYQAPWTNANRKAFFAPTWSYFI